MAISIILDFDNEWAGRLASMIEVKVEDGQHNPVIAALIDALPGIDTIDDLTPRQKAKLWILFGLLCDLSMFEGDVASLAAQQAVISDIETNFPLEVGDA